MDNRNSIINYYKKQSAIYDISRPVFLFGRRQIANWIMQTNKTEKILEIGCGTGYFLKRFKDKVNLKLTGIDLSKEMLNIARKKLENDRVELIEIDLLDYSPKEKYDTILLSYIFTIELVETIQIVSKIRELLKEGGSIYVLDFHKYGNSLYKKYMNWHGIEMGAELLATLENNFKVEKKIIKKAYFGTWQYFLFKGKNV